MHSKAMKPFGVLIEGQGESVKDLSFQEIKKEVLENQIVVLRGFKTFKDLNDFSQLCDVWGEVSLWPFGKVLELKSQKEPKDHIFDSSYVPMHWDGMYKEQVPELQVFHCVKAPEKGQGGRTLFSNTKLILKNASQDELKLWSKGHLRYKRKMEFYDSVTESPLISEHPYNGTKVLRFNELHNHTKGELINPVSIEVKGLGKEESKELFQSLDLALYAKENSYAHEWQDHDIVIADNFSLLHGREAFKKSSSRHIQRVQLQSTPPYNNPHLESYK